MIFRIHVIVGNEYRSIIKTLSVSWGFSTTPNSLPKMGHETQFLRKPIFSCKPHLFPHTLLYLPTYSTLATFPQCIWLPYLLYLPSPPTLPPYMHYPTYLPTVPAYLHYLPNPVYPTYWPYQSYLPYLSYLPTLSALPTLDLNCLKTSRTLSRFPKMF